MMAQEKMLFIEVRAKMAAAMNRELQYSHTNGLKIQSQWRKIMRLAKVNELQSDVQVLAQNHERSVDRREAIIQSLDQRLIDTQDEFKIATQSHAAEMDEIVALHARRRDLLEKAFHEKLKSLTIEFKKEKGEIIGQHSKIIEDLDNFDEVRKYSIESEEHKCIQDHEQRREVLRNQNVEHVDSLRLSLDTRIEDVEEKFENAHLSFLAGAEDRIKKTKDLAKKDEEYLKMINIKERSIDRLVNSIKHTEVKLKSKVAEGASDTSKLEEEKGNIRTAVKQLKDRLAKQRKSESKRLTDLIKNSSKAQSHLESALKLSQRIQDLAKLCEKLETDDDNIIPYRGTIKEWLVSQSKADIPEVIEEVGEMAEPHVLDLFWKKYNKVVYDKMVFDRRRHELKKENETLQYQVKQVIDGTTISDATMNRHDNLLLTIKGNNMNNRTPNQQFDMPQSTQGTDMAIAGPSEPPLLWRTRTRTNINPNDTEASAAGRSVRACVARKSKRQEA